MATTVFFTGKNGKADKVTFPSRALAESYAKTVKGALLEDSDAAVPVVAVKVCPVGTVEAQRASTRSYYKSVKTPEGGVVVETSSSDGYHDAENRAELMAEHFGAARAAGQSMEDAFSDWDYIQGVG